MTDSSGANDRDTLALKYVARFQSSVQRGERAAIVEHARQLVSLRPSLGHQWLSLASIVATNGEVHLAREAAELFVQEAGDDPAARYRLFAILAQVGDWSEAYQLLLTLPTDQPDPASYAYSRGAAALYLGDRDEAYRWLEAATRHNPLAGSPWLSLSVLVDFADHPELADRLIASEGVMADALLAQRAIYYYALGKAHADRADHASAFAAYARAARLMKQQFTYRRDADRSMADEAVHGYSREGIAALAGQQSEGTSRGMIVTGLPRSGTTLVEQVLTSHSEVSDGGEIYRLGLLAREAGGLSFPAIERYVAAGHQPAGARLWDHWLEQRFPTPGRIVDKTTDASRFLGLAATVLPEAPLIWLRRDPLDCAWSCFRTRFSGEGPWSHDLEDIAYHFLLEDQLLATWQDLLGERLLVVPYEDLASDPEPWIRRILAHCGLAEEPQAFAPHENARPVTTSSTMQVRRPINRAGIGSAEPYREFLQPFVDAYYA